MREYQDTATPGNGLLVLGDTLIKKMLSSLTRDERYKKMVQGLQATIVTLQKCNAFVQSVPSANHSYADRMHAVQQILARKELVRLRDTNIYQSLSVKKLSYYNHLLKAVLNKEMQELLNFVYEVDLYIAVSDVARAKGFSYARALAPEENLLAAKGLAHPCIDKAIGNNLELNVQNNVLFLTGANMAGKSTLMKAIGINFYLAHMGFPVAATEMVFSVREGMYSSINVADNIGLGYSHFYAEVVRVKQAAVAAASGKRLLLMFDELFKGTNVKDAYDGTLAVTKGFAHYQDCLFIVSTHIIEVAAALNEEDNVQFVYMPTVMEGVVPRYTYKLEKGITEDRQGMMIINNEGILELLNAQD